MAAGSTIAAVSEVRADQRSTSVTLLVTLSDYWALTKPEVNFLILITTFAGFYLATASVSEKFNFLLALHTLLGTLLIAGGTATLNQVLECRFDRLMRRTARRPVASGRIKPVHALTFGLGLAAAGSAELAFAVNGLACFLALLTLVVYLLVYTPLKRVSPLCTLVGAFPGAMPPLIGWAAASGRMGLEVWVLYAIVFLWQFPHFMAIAWMYREDYARAGYLVLPLSGGRDRFLVLHSLFASLALAAVSLLPAVYGKSGFSYLVGALICGGAFIYYSSELALQRSNTSARRLLVASIFYLPAVFLLMMLNVK